MMKVIMIKMKAKKILQILIRKMKGKKYKMGPQQKSQRRKIKDRILINLYRKNLNLSSQFKLDLTLLIFHKNLKILKILKNRKNRIPN